MGMPADTLSLGMIANLEVENILKLWGYVSIHEKLHDAYITIRELTSDTSRVLRRTLYFYVCPLWPIATAYRVEGRHRVIARDATGRFPFPCDFFAR